MSRPSRRRSRSCAGSSPISRSTTRCATRRRPCAPPSSSRPRYINDRKLPDKAIDVIDEVGASRMLVPEHRRPKTVTVKNVEVVVARIARIPPKSVSTDDRAALRTLDRDLKTMVFGQDEAIGTLSSAIKLSRAGLREPEKPIGCYLFCGPTGVGKTEVARQLARTMGVDLVRFDMSEYMERHSVSRLIGAPPGYVGFDQGGLLTDAIDQQPHAVLLLDEIEKAHPDLFNILLQVMDHGKLTDHNGKSVDFRSVIMIMTTNAGAADLAKPAIGFERTERVGDDTEAIERMFTPEFRNRLDATIRFARLKPDVVARVVDKFIMELETQLEDRSVTIELDGKTRKWLAGKGYDTVFGARPLARVIQEQHQEAAGRGTAVRQARQGRRRQSQDEGRQDRLHLSPPVRPQAARQAPQAPPCRRPSTSINRLSPLTRFVVPLNADLAKRRTLKKFLVGPLRTSASSALKNRRGRSRP